MLPVEIRRVQTRRERKDFVRSAWRFNRDDPCWVPPLVSDTLKSIDPDRGVFFDHGEAALFMAFRGAEPVGRISAHVNRLHDKYHGPETGFFGFFECIADQGVAGALLDAAAAWLREKGAAGMVRRRRGATN